MKKYFSADNDEFCFPLDYFREGQVLFEAKICRNTDMFWCEVKGAPGEKGYCGKQCRYYKPRNGKNGICKHNFPVYEKTNKKIII